VYGPEIALQRLLVTASPYALDVEGRYEVAYQEALRAVDDQARVLEQLRARAGTLFSAAGVTAAVLGLALDNVGPDDDVARRALRVGIAAFAVLAATTVAAWWPVKGGWFLMDARLIIRDVIEDQGLDPDEVYRELALHHGGHAERNAQIIRRRLKVHVVGLSAFAVLVGAFVVALLEVT
jgi:type VI protein secretion system component VasF